MPYPHLSALRNVAAIALAAALAGAAGCAGPQPGRAQSSPTVKASFGGTDLAWIEVNIAMDEQLEPLLALVLQHGAEPRTRSVADQVGTVVGDELSTLRRLHDEARLPSDNPHEGMPMPGMVTPSDLARAETLDASDLDALALQEIRGYLNQGVNLAESETKYGVEPRTVSLAAGSLTAKNEILISLSG